MAKPAKRNVKKMKYTIGGVCYTQTPIVLGQAIQLSRALKGVEGSASDLQSFIDVIGDKMPSLMAIALNPEGVRLQDKDIEAIAADLMANADLATTEQVVSDFFICNPITLLLERIEKATGVVGEVMGKLMLKFFSTMYASSLQEATLPGETASSGDSPVMN